MQPDAGNGDTPRTNVKTGGVGHFGLVLSLALAVSIAIAAAAPPAAAQVKTRLELTSTLLTPPPDEASLGRLTWLGGLVLSAPDDRFGGLSALSVTPKGARITALSDRGERVSFSLKYDAKGHLSGAGEGRIAPLLGPDSQPLDGKWNRDAESLAHLPGGSFVVAFEHNHRLWRYEGLSGPATPLDAPPGLEGLGKNSGIEALAALGGGDLLALAEGKSQVTESPAFLRQDGVWHVLSYRHEASFRPSGAARLPDGDILVVERFFTVLEGVKTRLVRVPGETVRPGARLEGDTLATLTPPLPLDNMEGIAVRQGAQGETLIYLISDDNFNILQRTLLMLFALKE